MSHITHKAFHMDYNSCSTKIGVPSAARILVQVTYSLFFKINAILAVLFKNMHTLKFKRQLTFASFAAINHLNRNLRKQKFTSTSSKGHGLRFVIGEFLYILWFCCSLLVIVIIIASAKNNNYKLAFTVQNSCVFEKCSKVIKHSSGLIAKFLISRCAFSKLQRNFRFFCTVNHLSGPLRKHVFTCH